MALNLSLSPLRLAVAGALAGVVAVSGAAILAPASAPERAQAVVNEPGLLAPLNEVAPASPSRPVRTEDTEAPSSLSDAIEAGASPAIESATVAKAPADAPTSALSLTPLPPIPDAYRDLLTNIADHLGLPLSLLHSVIVTESAFRPKAVSHKGAIGLMQLLPKAGARDAYEYLYGQPGTPTAEGLQRPEVNLWLGAAYLRLLEERHLSHIPAPARRIMQLAAYNWGIGRVQRHLAQGAMPTTEAAAFEWVDQHAPDETRQYVRRVLARMEQFPGVKSIARLSYE